MKTILFIFFYILDYVLSVILSFAFIKYYVSKSVRRIIVRFCRLFLFANYLLIFTIPYEIVYFKAKDNYLKELKEQNSSLINVTDISELNSTNSEIEGLRNILNLNYKIIFWVLVGSASQIIFYVIYFESSGEFTFWRKLFDSVKSNLIRTIIIIGIFGLLSLILKDIMGAIFVLFGVIPIIYAFVYLGLSIVKIPRNMYIHSNGKLALEYYEYKASKKLNELNKNNEELKKIYFRCQQTFEYIKNIEEFLSKEEKGKLIETDISNDNLDKEEETNNNIKDEKIEDENMKEEEKNIENENMKEEEKDIKKIEKDYKKHKSIIKEKKYVDLLNININEIINKNKIETNDGLIEKPIKKYKEIVELNEKSKELDSDNERINSQIQKIYKNWAILKELTMEWPEIYDINKENDTTLSLKENEFIPSMNVSKKKILFYRKYNKIIYLSLMIFFIIIGIIITLSEFSLVLPVNLSVLSLIFKNISDSILIHVLCILISSLLFIYVSYSFSKIKTMSKKFNVFEENQTNTLGLLYYCQKLSSISFPLSLNIINMIFHNNTDKSIKTSLEEQYGDKIGETAFYKILQFIPLVLIITIIINIFDIKSKICKKKKTSFYTRNEKREKYISEGKAFLMKMNRSKNSEPNNII